MLREGMLLNIESLKTFLVLSEEQNFNKAAQRLFVVQSTVSARIQELEKELAEREQKLQAINKEADLDKWCVKPETLVKSTPNPGPNKKAAKALKTQKNKKSKKIKTKKGR